MKFLFFSALTCIFTIFSYSTAFAQTDASSTWLPLDGRMNHDCSYRIATPVLRARDNTVAFKTYFNPTYTTDRFRSDGSIWGEGFRVQLSQGNVEGILLRHASESAYNRFIERKESGALAHPEPAIIDVYTSDNILQVTLTYYYNNLELGEGRGSLEFIYGLEIQEMCPVSIDAFTLGLSSLFAEIESVKGSLGVLKNIIYTRVLGRPAPRQSFREN